MLHAAAARSPLTLRVLGGGHPHRPDVGTGDEATRLIREVNPCGRTSWSRQSEFLREARDPDFKVPDRIWSAPRMSAAQGDGRYYGRCSSTWRRCCLRHGAPPS